jgi:hypothetical protein
MKRHFFVKVVLILAAIGLFSAGMRGAFSAGWRQGYLVGQSTEAKEDVMPYWRPGRAPFGHGHEGRGLVPHVGFRPFGLLRGLFMFALLLFLFALAAKTFGFWAWKNRRGKDWHKLWPDAPPPHSHPSHGHWPHSCPPHGHRPHGPMPPWCWAPQEADETESDEAEPAQEQVAKVKPNTREQES